MVESVMIKTCKNTSVIEYLLLSTDLFTCVNKFCVSDYDPMVSDVHNRSVNEHGKNFVKWKGKKSGQFKQAIFNNLGALDLKMTDLTTFENVTDEEVNSIDFII